MAKHYHLIGIGGIGMSAIAHLLLKKGFRVSGSDLKAGRATEELQKMGAQIFIGHKSENAKGADLVIYSSAIKEDNPEMRQAQIQKIPRIKRAVALAELMQDKKVITVTGSHGKTTTTSLISYLLLEAGLSPTMAIGGIFKNIGNNVSLGQGDFFIAEADESDGSFLYYHPQYSVVTNIDYEHLDYYGKFQNAVDTFEKFISQTKEGGCLFCSSDDENLRKLVRNYKNRYVMFGLNDSADIYPAAIDLKGLASQFDCFYRHKFVDRFSLSLGGMHNISNALSVVALGLELGIDLKIIKKILATYKGAGRRLEIKFQSKDFTVIDDYAHHPTEIKATLAALKELKARRIIAVFQPHRYSRTKLLLKEFGKSFAFADYVIVTDIYPAAEEAIPGVTGASVCENIKQEAPDKEAIFLAKEKITERILGMIKPQDLVVTLGAGDITKISDALAEELKK